MQDDGRPSPPTPLRLSVDRGKDAKKPNASMHHGGSFGEYMALKNTKLREQFEANCLQSMQQSNIFNGVSLFVNGHTIPSALELKQIMQLHGGRFENYCHRGHVTHIVCTNLPDTKLKQLATERDPIQIVRPEWVVESLKAGRLLPVKDFQLVSLRDDPRQLKLRSFREVDQVQPGELSAQLYPQLHAQQQPSGCAAPGEAIRPGPYEPRREPDWGGRAWQHGQSCTVEDEREEHEQGGGSGEQWQQQQQQEYEQRQRWQEEQRQGRLQPPPPQEPAEPQTGWRDEEPPRTSTRLQREQQQQQQQQQQQEQQQQEQQPSSVRRAQEVAAQLRSECDVLRGGVRSSKDDPNFVDTFYRSSRLHFIGTWKARIEALIVGELEELGPAPHPPPGQAAKQGSAARSIIHIDMDCFFASVATAAHPEFLGLPLVVCHSNSAKGTGEVSCANYEARAHGIHAGMFICEAKRLCPEVIVVPYLFELYQEVSERVYRILLRYTSCVQPLSCDEALLDVTGLGDAERMAAAMRAEIQRATGCTASAGIGPTILVARLATRHGKPNGQHCVSRADVLNFLADLDVKQLPGVGGSIGKKLSELGMSTVRQLRGLSKEMLQRQLGSKTGQTLWLYAHGVDLRAVEPCPARRSVGAECNYGVRCADLADAERLLRDLAAQVEVRLKAAGVRGRAITLKIKRRQAGAPEPRKFMGHGYCDNISRTLTVATFTDAADQLYEGARTLLLALDNPPEELRGIGIMVSKLDTDQAAARARPGMASASKLAAPPASTFQPRDNAFPWEAGAVEQPEPGKQQQQQQQPTAKQASVRGLAEPAAAPDAEGDFGAAAARAADSAAMAAPAPAPAPTWTEGGAALGRGVAVHQTASTSRAAVAPSAAATAARATAARAPALTLSQLDPEVLAELPADIRAEVEAACGLHQPIGRHPLHSSSGVKRAGRPGVGVGAPKRQARGAASSGRGVGSRSMEWDWGRGSRQQQQPQQQEQRQQQPQRQQRWQASDMGLTATQLDPEVLAELPPAVREEVLQQLRGTSRMAPPPPQQQQQQCGAELPPRGRSAVPESGKVLGSRLQPPGHAPPRPAAPATDLERDAARSELWLSSAGPFKHVRAVLASKLAELAAAATAAGSALQSHGEPSTCCSNDEAQRDSAIDPESLPGQRVRQPPRPHWLDAQAGLLCEYAAQWLTATDARLEEVSLGLRMLQQQRRRWPVLAPWCDKAVEAVQQHVQAKFGFRLECRGVLEYKD